MQKVAKRRIDRRITGGVILPPIEVLGLNQEINWSKSLTEVKFQMKMTLPAATEFRDEGKDLAKKKEPGFKGLFWTMHYCRNQDSMLSKCISIFSSNDFAVIR